MIFQIKYVHRDNKLYIIEGMIQTLYSTLVQSQNLMFHSNMLFLPLLDALFSSLFVLFLLGFIVQQWRGPPIYMDQIEPL